ncbi:DUF7507 domain-containing protein [Paenibacillus oleatilyticus]|uniref:DUF11 domain-containing protein n=1 Tax=Paenibacillus oleatilyticus TaxID=2594886 RepID=A0ABV4USN2_9BACL
MPGTQDSIGAFVTTNTAVAYGTYPNGTISAYQSNSSAAILNLPAGSTVLYAELIWGGTYINGNVNLTSAINNPVTLITPAGSFSVTPDSATSNQVDLGNGASAYVRSSNVTTLVQQGGAGTYTTGGVVGTIVIPGDSTANHAGWTLGVIYQNPSLPFRNMSIRAGAVLVQASSGPVLTTLTGFATPISGALGGRALFSAQEGDANRSGDQALFGPTSSSLSALSGPNNFANNFFASQINNDSGQLDTTGTFGTRNQTNGAPGSNIVGGRQGWDITNVDISARLVNNQSSAVLSLTTSGDAYVVNGNAIQVDINAPKINVVKSANVSGAIVGDTITYTAVISNTGTANAASVVLSDALPTGLTFVTGSVTVGGATQSTYDITAGAPLGSLNFGSSITVTYRARVTSLPSTQQFVNTANAAFTFQSVAGGSTISGVIPSNSVTITVYSPILTITKTGSTANATVGNPVTYTLQIANTGNIGAATTITDNIPAGSSFVAGSFRVNGVVVPGANPATGVAIGTIAAGGTSTVTFQVLVNSLPSPPQLVDQATAAYTYSPPDGRTVSGSASSNTLTIPVRLPSATVVKSVGNTDASVGDTLTYTSVITNNGLESISNVVLTDAIPSGTAFVAGSVTVGGAGKSSANPASGIAVGTIPAGSSSAVTFQVTVSSLPNPAQLLNQSSVSYSSGTFTGLSISNITTTPVYVPILGISKSANLNHATVGDTITYTAVVSNTGNIGASVTLTDPVPAGTSFVPNSVTVNGTAQPGASPVSGIALGTVAAGATVTVTFQFLLNSLPFPAFVTNTASGSYTYRMPSGRSLSGASSSNTVSISASAPNVAVTKTVNVTAAAVNDLLTYTVVVANNGIEAVNNVVVSDPIPSGAVFVAGSVTINGTPATAANPASGISIGTMNAGSSVTITFQVAVVSPPDPAQLSNRASVGFTSGALPGNSLSNTVVTPVYQPIFTVVKSASTSNATVGDTFNYSIQISNSGNIAANVNLTDNIPDGAAFAANSVLIDNTPLPGVSPVTGIPVGSVAPGATVTVSFVVTITSLPASRQLVNQASAAYSFTLPDTRQLNGAKTSNSVTIPVSSPNVSVTKSASAANVVTGDTLTFTSIVTNNGITNVNNVIFSDSLPGNTSFITGSVFVNGFSRPNADPSAGIPIGTLAPGAAATITFEVKITMPIPSQISNQSKVSFTSGTFSGSSSSNVTVTPVTQPQITLAKSASTSNATIGDTITYTVNVSNSGNLPAVLTLTDTVPAGTTFSPNSVIVGGVPQPGSSPATGINVGTVAPGASIIVTFVFVVTSLPTPQQISNQASATYTYTPPDGRTLTGSAVSNIVTFPVSATNVSVAKSTPTTAAAVGDTITYTITVSNGGIEAVSNVLLSDKVPSGAAFVPGSVTINGVPSSLDPNAGIALGSIAPSASVTVTFNITVTAIPATGQLSNQAAVSFTSGAFSGTAFSNTTLTPIFQPIIAVAKSASTSNATLGDTVTYTLIVNNTGNYPAQITLTDTIPAGTTFVPNSVIINGSSAAGADPSVGINAGSIAGGATTTVMFSVVIDTLPTPQQLVNQGSAAYTFTLPNGTVHNGSALSNTVTIPLSAPNVTVVKSTPTTATYVGDVLVYSTAITNAGIETVNNVVFTDPLPAGTALVPGSVTVDSVARPDANPATGITIGSIAPGVTATVAFSANVTSLPTPAVLNNQSSVSFTSGAFSAVTFSNTVSTPVYQAIFNAAKSANTVNATVGDTVVYTIQLNNTGNIGASVTLSDTIPVGTTLVPNSVLLNGSPVPGADPSAGIPLGIVTASATVTFSVVIDSLPPSQRLSNQASGTYTFTIPDGRSSSGTFTSNTNIVSVSAPNISVAKSSASTDAVVGDTVVYSIVTTNSGIENVNNVILTDSIPAGTSFVPGSVTVNGTPRPAATPTAGISLGTIAPGTSSTVAFSVTVNTLPSPAQLSNQASVSFTSGAFSGTAFSNTLVLPVYQPIVGIVKSANKTNATVGDTIVYALNVTNTGNLAANITVTDVIPTGTAIVPNSVLINGVPQPGIDPSTGIPLGNVPAGATVNVTVTLEVTVDSLPSPQQLVNQATASYTYSPPDGRVLTGSVNSNVLVIPVSAPDVSVVKSTNAVDAVVGDVITYTIVVTNNGIEPVNNVVLIDPIPAGTVFVDGSVVVDGVSRPAAHPDTGIPIGTIANGASSTVTFNVQVTAI